MKTARGPGLLSIAAAVFLLAAPAVMSCSGGGGGGSSSNDGSSGSSQYKVADVASKAASSMGSDGVVGALLASDHGYSLRQIADAIMEGNLDVSGIISSGGGETTPAYPAPETLDVNDLLRLSPDTRHFTAEEIAIIRGVVELWLLIEQQETDDLIKSTLLAMGEGYLADLIVEAIVGHNLSETGDIPGKSPNGTPQTDVFVESGGGSTDTGGTGGDSSGGDELPSGYPITYEGYGNYTSSASITWGAGNSVTCQEQIPWEITLYADGTLTAVFYTSKGAVYYAGDSGYAYCAEGTPYKETRTGTHSNGQFSITMYGTPLSTLTGTYNAYGIQGSWEYTGSLSFDFGTSTITTTHSFNIVTKR